MLLESVKKYVLSLEIGAKLPDEVRLAAKFKVSRSTIREAVCHLKQLGILERGTGTGTFVKAPTVAEISETLSLQLQLAGIEFEELKAMRIFLEVSQVPLVVQHATPTAICELRNLTDQMERACRVPEKADALDMRFHLALIGICGNRLLTIFSQVIARTFEKRYRKKFLNPRAARKSVRDHRQMIECLQAGDAEKLAALMEDHLHPL